MKKLKVISILLVACLLVPLLPINLIAASTHSTISGVISLPNGDVAPTGGVKVKLSVGTDNNTANNKDDDKSVTTELTIAKGHKSIAYSIQVPKSQNTKAKYTVFYEVGNNYAPFGWYSKDGTVAIKDNRTQVDLNSGDIKNINIKLLEGRVISGKIVLGNEVTKPVNDMSYTITAIQEGSNAKSNEDDIIITKDVIVKANNEEVSYKLIVPMNSAKKGYKVYYTYENGGYKETGFYDKDGTSRDASDVTLIDVANTVKNIDLETLPFTNISGKVYLPDKDKAPTSGIEVQITALNKNVRASSSDDFSFTKSVKIPKGSNSVSYNLTVPVAKTDYILSYKIITKNIDYIIEGYYNKAETKKDIDDATAIKTTNKAISGIALDIIEKDSSIKPKPTPKPKSDDDFVEQYDVNGDGYVNIFDIVDLAKAIVGRYEKDGFDKDLDQYKDRKLDEKDLNSIRDAFKPFSNNRYKLKWFNSLNDWFDFGKWGFDKEYWDDFENWGNWNGWTEGDWKKKLDERNKHLKKDLKKGSEFWKGNWGQDSDDWEDFWEDYLEDWFDNNKKSNGWNNSNNKNKNKNKN